MKGNRVSQTAWSEASVDVVAQQGTRPRTQTGIMQVLENVQEGTTQNLSYPQSTPRLVLGKQQPYQMCTLLQKPWSPALEQKGSFLLTSQVGSS